ncbi:TonB-dependent receptor [Marinicauda algicola]|uniref:TonB-dependent receptor n=1 Tax=Marinicauda algicola TaxID=2029849 RepID=A0A4S2H2X6_9PROT|nr:TonB-dependent receptor [Marinicauda algicola]TGY89896.1 TonB-dependent receptor [Marinicauda algicola]
MSRTLSRHLMLAASATVLASAGAHAQSEEPVDVITVTSTPLETRADEVVGSVDVIGSEALIRDLNGNLADTLESLPGVTSTYYGPASGRPIVRGLGADRVRVLINGLGGLDASTASPDHAVTAEVIGAQQVEVLRGPAAIAYGGGAIGGVVNVIDARIPTALPEDGFDGFLYAGTTSVDEGSQFAARGTAAIGQLVLQADWQRREADDFEIPGFAESERLRELEHEEEHGHEDEHEDEHEEEELDFGSVSNSGYTFETVSLAGSVVGDWGYVGIGVKETDADYGLPGHAHAHEEEHEEGHAHGLISPADAHEDEHGEEEEIVTLGLEQTRVDLRGEFNRDAFFNRIRWSFAHADYVHTEFEGDEVGTIFDKEGIEGRVEVRHQHGGPRQGAIGLQLLAQDFAAVGAEAYLEPTVTQDWGLFVTERWDFDAWGVEGGLRWDTRNLDGLRAERDFDTLSGSLSLFARPGEGWFTGFTLSRTERAPTDAEVFANGPHIATRAFEVGNLDLGTETAWSGEATVRRDMDRFGFEATGFYAAYDGFIGLFPTGEEEDGLDVFEYRQEDATLYGFEAKADARLGEAGGFDFSAEASADYVRGELDDGGNLPRIPPLSGTLALIADRGNVSLRAEGRFVAEQDEITSFEMPTDSFALFNADARITPFADKDIAILVGVRNITDEEARLHTSFLKDQVPLPGRSVRAAISARF